MYTGCFVNFTNYRIPFLTYELDTNYYTYNYTNKSQRFKLPSRGIEKHRYILFHIQKEIKTGREREE